MSSKENERIFQNIATSPCKYPKGNKNLEFIGLFDHVFKKNSQKKKKKKKKVLRTIFKNSSQLFSGTKSI